jgi:hypothetical protein
MSVENENIEKSITPESYINQQSLERQTVIGYVVPHEIFPDGYHVNPKEPLPFISLANQKGYIAIYHLGLYADKLLMEWFAKSYEILNIGKLDMGKSCIRLKKINKIPMELIGELCARMPVEEYISIYLKYKPQK